MSGIESREYGRRDPSRLPHGTLYPKKLALTSLTSGGRSVSTIRLWTQVTEFFNRISEFIFAAMNFWVIHFVAYYVSSLLDTNNKASFSSDAHNSSSVWLALYILLVFFH
jgi:hypothetical protein